MSGYSSLRVSQREHVVEITLSRPDLMNRVDDESREELIAVLADYGYREDVRAIVLAAEGKVFSAGGDFDMIRRKHGDRAATQRGASRGRQLIVTLVDCPVPIIAALHGDVFGVGTTVVLSCDLVVAARGVRIVDSHVKVGLVAGDGGGVMWPLSVGMIRTKRHLLTGDPMLAEDGHALGMVSDLVDQPDEVLPLARELAERIAGLPPRAVQGTKRALNHAVSLRAAESLDLSIQYEEETLHTEDLLRAIDGLQNKTKPVFEGR